MNGEEFDNQQGLAGDTKIPLLDGTEIDLADLVDHKRFWTYSVNMDGRLRPGLGCSVKEMAKAAAVIKITLDDNSSLSCSPGIKLLRRSNEYVEARFLVPGDSLMPLYRDKHSLDGSNRTYERTYEATSGKWIYTHRFALPGCPKGYVRHHKDFNRYNNSPDNLELMDFDVHLKLHQKHIVEATREARERMLRDGTHPFLRERTQEDRERARQHMIRVNEKYNGSDKQKENLAAFYKSEQGIEKRKLAAEIIRVHRENPKRAENFKKYRESPEGQETFRKVHERNGERLKSPEHQEKMRIYRESEEGKQVYLEAGKKTAHKRWHVGRGIVKDDCEYCKNNNHKIVSIEEAGTENIYAISIKKFHAFAIGCGVFVRNFSFTNNS